MSDLTYDELQEQIKELQLKAELVRQAEFANALKAVKEQIKKYGFTSKDLGLSKVSQSNPPVKYKLDNNTWSGKGRKPNWLLSYLSDGKKLDDLLVSK